MHLTPVGLAARLNANRLLPNQTLKELENLATQKAAEKGYAVCNVQILAHLKPMTIQIQVKQCSGKDVSLEDCALLSGPMGDSIEDSQLITAPYVLEISSPGISDQLTTDRDFKTFHGFPVEVIYTDKTNSQKSSQGLLHERSNDHVHLNIKGRMNRIPRNDVKAVRLISPTG